MQIKLLSILTLIILIGCSKEIEQYDNLDNFAKCLTEKEIKIYGTEWCSHCKNQKQTFGNSFQYIDYIDCDKNKNECLKSDIQGYLTWEIDGKKYPGEQSLQRLSQLSECEVK